MKEVLNRFFCNGGNWCIQKEYPPLIELSRIKESLAKICHTKATEIPHSSISPSTTTCSATNFQGLDPAGTSPISRLDVPRKRARKRVRVSLSPRATEWPWCSWMARQFVADGGGPISPVSIARVPGGVSSGSARVFRERGPGVISRLERLQVRWTGCQCIKQTSLSEPYTYGGGGPRERERKTERGPSVSLFLCSTSGHYAGPTCLSLSFSRTYLHARLRVWCVRMVVARVLLGYRSGTNCWRSDRGRGGEGGEGEGGKRRACIET